ncbi:MAG TPA: hypothetical protein O0X32_02980, partial [Methanocorpusculum sp.]|nr:hypothetical protein [Methanocorpusculum sp.]
LKSAIRHPNFIWKSESEAVKQGVCLLLSILIAFGTLIIAFILIILGIEMASWWVTPLLLCGFSLIIFGIALLMHHTLNKKQIIDIE